MANSANPYRQLSLVFLSRIKSTRRRLPSLAPRLASPVVDATFELPFLEIDAAGGDDRREGLYNLATPFASRSSLTVGSRPRKSKNWEGVPFGEASLSPLFIVGCCFTMGALPKVDISAWFQLYELLVRCVEIVPIWGDWHLKHLNLPGKLTKVHLG